MARQLEWEASGNLDTYTLAVQLGVRELKKDEANVR